MAVNLGNVFASFVHEAQSIANEVVARRRFSADVADYLNEKGIAEEFALWLAKRDADRG